MTAVLELAGVLGSALDRRSPTEAHFSRSVRHRALEDLHLRETLHGLLQLRVIAHEGLKRVHAVAMDGNLLHRPAQVCPDVEAQRRRDTLGHDVRIVDLELHHQVVHQATRHARGRCHTRRWREQPS